MLWPPASNWNLPNRSCLLMGRNWQPQVSKCLFLSSEESKGFQVSRGRRYLSPQNQVQWEASTSLHYGTYLEQNENKKNRRLINWKFSEIGKALQYPVSIFFMLMLLFLSKLFFFLKEFTMCSSRKNLFSYLTSEILERDDLISWRHVDSTESQKRFEPLRAPIMILLWMAPRTRLSL